MNGALLSKVVFFYTYFRFVWTLKVYWGREESHPHLHWHHDQTEEKSYSTITFISLETFSTFSQSVGIWKERKLEDKDGGGRDEAAKASGQTYCSPANTVPPFLSLCIGLPASQPDAMCRCRVSKGEASWRLQEHDTAGHVLIHFFTSLSLLLADWCCDART